LLAGFDFHSEILTGAICVTPHTRHGGEAHMQATAAITV